MWQTRKPYVRLSAAAEESSESSPSHQHNERKNRSRNSHPAAGGGIISCTRRRGCRCRSCLGRQQNPSNVAAKNAPVSSSGHFHEHNDLQFQIRKTAPPPLPPVCGILKHLVQSQSVQKNKYNNNSQGVSDLHDSATTTSETITRRSISSFQRQEDRSLFLNAEEKNNNNKGEEFGRRILQDLYPHRIALKDNEHYKTSIFNEILALTELRHHHRRSGQKRKASTGHTTTNNMSKSTSNVDENRENNFPFKMPALSPKKWVYQTPPNRKMSFGGAMKSNLQPAVLEDQGGRKVIYKMNPNIKVDLNRLPSVPQRCIDIDKRFLQEVASLPVGGEFMKVERRQERMQCSPDQDDDQINEDSCPLENYFSSLTCRPKKTVTTRSRRPLKRKRDIFEAPEEQMEMQDVAGAPFHIGLASSEESFRIELTPSSSESGGTEGLLFDFSGKRKDTFHLY